MQYSSTTAGMYCELLLRNALAGSTAEIEYLIRVSIRDCGTGDPGNAYITLDTNSARISVVIKGTVDYIPKSSGSYIHGDQ